MAFNGFQISFIANSITVSAISSDEIEALEDLKATNEIITSSLHNDLLVLQSKHRNLTTDFETQKTELYDAVLSKNRLMNDLEDMKKRDDPNEQDLIEKARARAILEEQASQNSLKEVSRRVSLMASEEPKTPRKGRFWEAFLGKARHPHTTKSRRRSAPPAHKFPDFSLGQ